MFLIDVSGEQATLDMGLVKAAGNEAVIVKAVAAYRPEHTVADGYYSNIDRVIAAGLPKGHYLVPNSRNTPKQSAAFFAANLYREYRGDVFMLDNEPLDSYATHWRDDQVMEFFEEFVRLTGVAWSQLWLYCPAALTRSTGPWTRVEEARKAGLRIVWVSYGDNDPLREDGEEPLLGGGITGWNVHQFTSTYRIDGYAGNLDRNYSPHKVTDLFGGVPVATEADIRAWLSNYPRAWDQLCQALMWQLANKFGRVKSTPESAILAYHVEKSAGRIRTGTPPPGSFVYWDIGAFGHVGFVMNGGRVLMATRHLVEEWVGTDAGWQTVDGYTRATGADYLGWSYQNGGNTVPFSTASGPSGDGYTPIEEDDMFTDDDRKRLAALEGALAALTRSQAGVIKDPAGNYHHADDFGGENIAADGGNGISGSNLVDAAKINPGVASVGSEYERQLVTQIANRRWARKKGEIAAAVVEALAAAGGLGGALDEAKLAELLGPQLVLALSESGAATAAALESVRTEILAAIAGVDEATLATFGLKRA